MQRYLNVKVTTLDSMEIKHFHGIFMLLRGLTIDVFLTLSVRCEQSGLLQPGTTLGPISNPSLQATGTAPCHSP